MVTNAEQQLTAYGAPGKSIRWAPSPEAHNAVQNEAAERAIIRREIATAALQSILLLNNGNGNGNAIEDDAEYAVRYADALIAELAK